MNYKEKLPIIKIIILAFFVGSIAGYIGFRFASRTFNIQKTEQDGMEKIITSKYFRIGYIVFPPAICKPTDGDKPIGHMIDVVKFIALQINVEINFQETTWATFVAGLQSKQYDVVVAPLFSTPSRATAVAFTEPLYYLGMSVIAKRGDLRFVTVSDLNKSNIKIAVNQGGANQKFAKQYCQNAKLTELATSDISQVLSEVVSDRADAAIADSWSISKFVEQNKSAVQVLFDGKALDITGISWAVRSDDIRLLNFLNTTIKYLNTTGKMKEFETLNNSHWIHLKEDWEQN